MVPRLRRSAFFFPFPGLMAWATYFRAYGANVCCFMKILAIPAILAI
jgi:hypothetical protein